MSGGRNGGGRAGAGTGTTISAAQPPSGLVTTWLGFSLGWQISWTPGALARGTRIYRTDSEELAEPWANPFTKTRVTPGFVTGSSYQDLQEPRPGVTYTYYLCSVDVAGNETAQVAVTAVTPNVPQNHLNLWNRDLTKIATADGGTTKSGWFHWKGDAGVTVAASGSNPGATSLTFGGANQAFYQTISTYQLNRAGAIYSFYIKVKGTAGQTIQVFAHGDDGNGNPVSGATWNSAALALTGGVDEFVVTRPAFLFNARFLRFGLQTYNSVTARVFDVFELRAAAGTLTLSQMQADSALVSGPGTTWHEPVAPTSTVSLTGLWFRSQDSAVAGTPALYINNDSITVTLDRCRTETQTGDHVYSDKGGYRFVSSNHRHYGRTPRIQGAARGLIYRGDYAQHVQIEHFYAYRTCGVSAQLFTGTSGVGSVLIRYYFYRELDGKRYNADGTPVQTTWGGVNYSQAPSSLASGCIIANAVRLAKINGTGSSGSITNPNGEGVVGGEHAYGACFGRAGFSDWEDFFNYSEWRGTSTSPFRTHDILSFGIAKPDFDYFNGLTTTYNMARRLCSYTQSITTTAATTGTGSATTLTVSALTGPVPPNQSFTIGGQTLQASSEAAKGSTTINVKAFTGTVGSGVTGSGAFRWGPAYISSSGGLTCDGTRSDRWEQNAAYLETYNIVAIGPELILADLDAGNDRNFYASENYLPLTLPDSPAVTIPALGRNFGVQNSYTLTTPINDKSGTPQVPVQNVAMFNLRTYGGGSNARVSGGYPTWKTGSHTIYPTPTAAQCWARAARFMDDLAAAGIVLGVTA